MTDKVLGIKAEPELADLLLLMKQDIIYSMNCIQIGKIEAFNNVTNMADVSISMKRRLADGSELAYPLLKDCPVFILNGGGASLTMPITKGDDCIILFNDRNIEDWWLTGAVKIPKDSRAHAFSDAMVLVGIRNLTTASTIPSVPCLDGGLKKLSIKNDVTDLKTLILALIDAISALTVTCASPGSPSSIPINIAAFTALKTQFQTLLD